MSYLGLTADFCNYRVAFDLLQDLLAQKITFAGLQGLLNVSLTPRAQAASYVESVEATRPAIVACQV